MVNFKTRFSYFKTGDKVISNSGKEQIYKLFHIKYPNVPIDLLHQIDDLDYFFWSKHEDKNPNISHVIEIMMKDIENYCDNYGIDTIMTIFKKQCDEI